MTTAGIFIGAILILIGVAGYIYGMNTGHPSPTALIPAAFGLVIAILCIIGRANESIRKHVMHVAVLIGLLGFILPLGRLILNYEKFSMTAATISQLAMAIVCLLFVLGGVQSFRSARRERRVEVIVDQE
jgi:hypothetical protein